VVTLQPAASPNMRFVVLMALLSMAAGQTLTTVSEVGRLITTVSSREGSYSIYQYEGVGVEGDLTVQDFRAALDVVKPQLAEGERVTTMSASQQVPSMRAFGKDVVVKTQEAGCNPVFVDCGGGRLFILERIDGKLRVHSIAAWIA
jgi:hypothetical protein